jgi:hypothetical protein
MIWERRHGPVGTGMKEGSGVAEGNHWSNLSCELASVHFIVFSV